MPWGQENGQPSGPGNFKVDENKQGEFKCQLCRFHNWFNWCGRDLHAAFVTFEAESARAGPDCAGTDDGTADYITIRTDCLGLNFPGNSNRMAAYTVTSSAGTYSLFAGVRVSLGGGTDDSCLYGNSFGTRSTDQRL